MEDARKVRPKKRRKWEGVPSDKMCNSSVSYHKYDY